MKLQVSTIIFLGAGLWGFTAAAEPEVISTSVGRVGNHVVTSREVHISDLIERTLYPQKGSKAESGQLKPLKSDAFVREVSNYLLERAIDQEAQNVAAVRVEDSEVDQAAKVVNSQLKDSSAWKNLRVSSEELRQMTIQKIHAKKFIRLKGDSSLAPITEGEVRRYYEQNRTKFSDLPYENFRDNIRAYLTRQQLDRRLKDWFEVLRSKYKVRNLVADR